VNFYRAPSLFRLIPYYRNVMKNSSIYAERLVLGDVMIGERW
jgi:hypothetical protein